jgi:hypothetical protein
MILVSLAVTKIREGEAKRGALRIGLKDQEVRNIGVFQEESGSHIATAHAIKLVPAL